MYIEFGKDSDIRAGKYSNEIYLLIHISWTFRAIKVIKIKLPNKINEEEM